MDSSSKSDAITFEFPPYLRIYKDGRAERTQEVEFIPPSTNTATGVSCKDVVIEPETGLSARFYLPNVEDRQFKLPLVIYFHGGGFCTESAFSPLYHPYVESLVAEAKVVAISVNYRRAPEHPVPMCYEDSWTSLIWVASQSKKEAWLKDYVDFTRVFIAGDSAGANIAQNIAVRTGCSALKGLKINGLVLIHPHFAGKEPFKSEVDNFGVKVAGKMWRAVCPLTTGLDDPFINPDKDPNFSSLGCKRVLVCIAEKDIFRDRGQFYCDNLRKSVWDGMVELMETEGEYRHVFHLYSPTCEKARDLMKCVVSFINTSE